MILFKTEKGTMVQYESLTEYRAKLESPSVSGRYNSSNSGDDDFTGTKSFDEAEKLRVGGDMESKKKISEVKVITDKLFEKAIGKTVMNFDDVMGYQPIVPNAIIGLPKSMINQKRKPKKAKVITIVSDMGIPWCVDKSVIEFRGALLLSAIDNLEKQGYRVELYVGVSSAGYGSMGEFIRIKNAEQPLNIYKIAYYIVNPSFLRRTHFRILETEEALPNITTNGYGSNSGFEKREEFIRDNVLKGKPSVIFNSNVEISPEHNDEENIAVIKELFKDKL